MSIRTTRSILLEQDDRHINVCGVNCEYVLDEILDFMKDEYIRTYQRHFELYDRSPGKCELLKVLLKVKDCIKEIEEELDISFKEQIENK